MRNERGGLITSGTSVNDCILSVIIEEIIGRFIDDETQSRVQLHPPPAAGVSY